MIPSILVSLSLALTLAVAVSAPIPRYQVPAQDRYEYTFVHGQTAMHRNGIALAPRHMPASVHHAMTAGNELQRFPYKWGGGHAVLNDNGYDCSGSVSYILRRIGALQGSLTAKEFMNYGEAGAGRWITIYAKGDHVFITIAGLRLDTGGTANGAGPRWKSRPRSTKGFVLRHPRGF